MRTPRRHDWDAAGWNQRHRKTKIRLAFTDLLKILGALSAAWALYQAFYGQ